MPVDMNIYTLLYAKLFSLDYLHSKPSRPFNKYLVFVTKVNTFLEMHNFEREMFWLAENLMIADKMKQ